MTARHSADRLREPSARSVRSRRWFVTSMAVTSAGFLAASAVVAGLAGSADASAPITAQASSQVAKSVSATRIHVDPVTGADVPVDSRTIAVTVDQTTLLRDRQVVSVSWSGAHPTGGLVADNTSIAAAQQEYPVVVMQCRGVDSTTAPVAAQIRPETCWTQSSIERVGAFYNFPYPAFRLDRFSAAADRGTAVGVPSPLPADCARYAGGVQSWMHFVGADGTDYPGGPSGCGGIPPEAVNFSTSLQPSNTTYGETFSDGTGSAQFIINTTESNASLGCSNTVKCALVVVPIVGLSCDAGGMLLPASDRTPSSMLNRAKLGCESLGNYSAGQQADSGSLGSLPVTGSLWWLPSNWRNHVSFPLTFSTPANVCDLVSTQKPTYVYGSQMLAQATQQWAPTFCLDPKLFKFQHVQFSEPASRNLLGTGSIEAAFVGGPPEVAYDKPIVQAPIAVSGFAIAFRLDDHSHREVDKVNLTPRLIAKLLTMSYPGSSAVQAEYTALKDNPTDIIQDPEFRALNPNSMTYGDNYDNFVASTLYSISSDSDVTRAVTSYLQTDADARKWLDGEADPWGMKVNPSYKSIALPVNNWPTLDTFQSATEAGLIPCIAANPVPWLPLVAAPVSNPATVTLNMQYQIANSQVVCKDAGQPNQKLTAVGRIVPGRRAMFGLVPLSDAARYKLPVASLLSHTDSSAPAQFTDTTGRTFVAPNDASLKAAAALLKPDKALGTWPVPYATLRGDQGTSAYPGTMLLSINVPTSGLPSADASRYSQLITFMTTKGQTPGLDNGQLPGGYLPLTAASGLSSLQTYAAAAAAAVKAQQAYVPAVDGSSTPPSPTPSPTPLPSTGPPTSDNGGYTDNGGTSGDTTGGGAGTPTPSGSSSPSASPSVSTITLVDVGKTAAVVATPASTALPFLVGLAILTGLTALATSLWGRR